jgi:Dolichyl-phosphate-mannose-protein mannosyltransferase
VPPSDIQPDLPADRRLYLAFTLLAIGLFAAAMACYFVPASRGGDKNGYLLGGKAMLSHPLRGLRSPDEYAYLGRYWIRLPSGRYGLKFSPGLPALDAVVMGIARGSATAGHAVTPVCTVLALLGAFFLFGDLAGSFAAFLGVVILASNSTVLVLANTPTSHAPALCTVTWGLYLLLRWWRDGIVAAAIGAGLLLGYSATIRYTEVLLLMPMAAAIFTRCWPAGSFQSPRCWATISQSFTS